MAVSEQSPSLPGGMHGGTSLNVAYVCWSLVIGFRITTRGGLWSSRYSSPRASIAAACTPFWAPVSPFIVYESMSVPSGLYDKTVAGALPDWGPKKVLT